MLTAIEKSQDKVNVFNLGTDEYCEVNDSIGWIGDSPFIFLDTAKIRSLGWKPKLSIREDIALARARFRQILLLRDRGEATRKE